MRRLQSVFSGFALLLTGYVAGSFSGTTGHLIQSPGLKAAQEGAEDTVTAFPKDVLDAYKKSNKAVRELNNLFVAGGQSTQAFSGMNYFGASVGGVNAELDLEEGRGVDPETFAALYAGLATPKVSEDLDIDELGRLRYKGNVIRLYSQERLKQMFQKRDQLEIRSESGE